MNTSTAAGTRVDQTGRTLEDATRAYRALGVIALRDFFSPEDVAALAAEAEGLLLKYHEGAIDERRVALRPTIAGPRIFERLDPVCDIAPACAALARDPRLLALADALVGGAPFLFKDKIIYKFPHDAGYGVHQDYPYYDLHEALKDKVVTIAIAIDDVAADSGGVDFFLRRHDRVQAAPPGQPRDCDPAALGDPEQWNATLSRGSLVAFHTLTPHGSGANNTVHTRRMLYLTYIDKSAAHLREQYYQVRIADRIAP